RGRRPPAATALPTSAVVQARRLRMLERNHSAFAGESVTQRGAAQRGQSEFCRRWTLLPQRRHITSSVKALVAAPFMAFSKKRINSPGLHLLRLRRCRPVPSRRDQVAFAFRGGSEETQSRDLQASPGSAPFAPPAGYCPGGHSRPAS